MNGFSLAKLATSALVLVSLAACTSENSARTENVQSATSNPVSYFEIPVADMARAIDFYQAVFAVSLQQTLIDGHEMALFPFDESNPGVSGALAKGDSYVPSKSGPRIYFSVENIDETLSKVVGQQGRVAYAKTLVGDFWVAEFIDSEGNQIALSSANN